MPSSDRPFAARALPIMLLVLTVFGPISMDLYLPALPALTQELAATTSVAQLTITACLIGLAFGQLIAGPLSDRFGRRPVVLAGVAAYVITSAVCALSPSIELLIATRLLQGVAGGAGIVIAQAAGRDVFSGAALLRFYARVTVIGGLAAVVGPLLGGVLTVFTDWRGLFTTLAIAGAAIFALVLMLMPETLPVFARSGGGLAQSVRNFRSLLADRVVVGALLNQGFLYAALFAYLAGATYALQDIYGLSPQAYAAAFGLNSVGFMIFGHLGGIASGRWSVRGTMVVGGLLAAAGALGLLVSGLVAMPLWVVLVSLFALAAGVAASSPPATILALEDYPHIAGTASSLLGMIRFGLGGVAAPLVGVAGALSMLPLGVVTTTAVALALAVLPLARARHTAIAPTPAEAHLVASTTSA